MSGDLLCNGRYKVLPSSIPRGRSGIAGLAMDTRSGDIVFTKSTDLNSPDYDAQRQSLESEAMALRELAGFGVPSLLDVCQEPPIGLESRESLCLVMENVSDAECVGSIYPGLAFIEGIEILVQFFACLANAHARRVINGDVDLKHLYWRSDRRQLLVVDWGNARTATQASDYVSDLLESGEVVHTLITLESFPPEEDRPLRQLPQEAPEIFQNLVRWSRQKDYAAIAALSAQNLKQAANDWKTALVNQLLTQAHETYHGGAIGQALRAYREVLKWDPRNSQAMIQVLKAEHRRAEDVQPDIPFEARRLLSEARSTFRMGMLTEASRLLKQAQEVAERAGVDFREARDLYEDVQIRLQNVLLAEKYSNAAARHLENQEWSRALQQLERAFDLDPSNTNAGRLLHGLRDLLAARSLIEQIQTGVGDGSVRLMQLRTINETIEATSKIAVLDTLWSEVVREYKKISPRAKEAERAVQKQEASERKAERVGTLVRSTSWAIVLSLVLVLVALWFIYLLPRQTAVVECAGLPKSLSILLTFPAYLANGDDGQIQVTAANDVAATAAVSGTILIDFRGPAATRVIDPARSNLVEFASLAPGERKSAYVNFTFDEPIQLISDPSRYLEFGLLVSQGNQPCDPGEFHVAAAPIYKLRSVITFLWGSLGVAVVGLLWNRIKRLLGQ